MMKHTTSAINCQAGYYLNYEDELALQVGGAPQTQHTPFGEVVGLPSGVDRSI